VAFVWSEGKAADKPSFTLKYGILAGLTGDPATSGQAWNEAAKLGIEEVAAAVKRVGLDGVEVVLTDSQDSQGSPQPGVEGAQKLVQIDGVDVIIGDFYSSVTSAEVTSVTMPNKVLVFTGGTSPALTKLNTSLLAVEDYELAEAETWGEQAETDCAAGKYDFGIAAIESAFRRIRVAPGALATPPGK
jgi:hypothetical protein